MSDTQVIALMAFVFVSAFVFGLKFGVWICERDEKPPAKPDSCWDCEVHGYDHAIRDRNDREDK